MTSAEVSMQDVEEVVIVTIPEDTAGAEEVQTVEEEEEEEEGDDNTILVSTELTQQPGEGEVLTVTQIESPADSCSTDALEKNEAVIVKLTEEVELGVDVEADVYYPITCGEAKATLVWKKFVCPGINIKCIQCNDQLISPKEFVGLAGKSTLKDWKRAIRLNGTMLRRIMDSGELDFYQHSKVCSNTCRSTKIDLVASRASISSQQSTELIPVTPSTADLNGSPATFPEAAEESTEWVTAIGEDSVTFWRGMKEAGLLGEVVEEFQKELQDVLKAMQDRVAEPPLQVKDAALLNNIVQNFGMLDLVKKVLAGHKSQMDRYREQYTRSLAALEQQCDEHRKRAKELKSKSQHLNNVLMTLAPAAAAPAPPTPKRPRLTRAATLPAAAFSSAPTQITLPLSQLNVNQLGKLLTVGGGHVSAGGGGGYTLLTSPIGATELAPGQTSNLTVLSTASASVQDGGVSGATTTAFLKVLGVGGPQYQLVTLPASLGATLQGLSSAQGTVLQLPMGNFSVVGGTTSAALGHGGGGEVLLQAEPQVCSALQVINSAQVDSDTHIVVEEVGSSQQVEMHQEEMVVPAGADGEEAKEGEQTVEQQ